LQASKDLHDKQAQPGESKPGGAAATAEALRGQQADEPYQTKEKDWSVLPEKEQIEIRERLLQAAVKAPLLGGGQAALNEAVHKIVQETGVVPPQEVLVEIYQAFQSRLFRRAEEAWKNRDATLEGSVKKAKSRESEMNPLYRGG